MGKSNMLETASICISLIGIIGGMGIVFLLRKKNVGIMLGVGGL